MSVKFRCLRISEKKLFRGSGDCGLCLLRVGIVRGYLYEFAVLAEMLHQFVVEAVVGKGLGVAYYDKLHAGTSHGDVHAAQVAQEADLAVGIVSHQRDDNHVALLALEAVDGAYGDVALEFAEVVLHLQQPPDESRLTAVGGDDSEVDALALNLLR